MKIEWSLVSSIFVCVLVAVGFFVAFIVALKVKKWSWFALIFILMMLLSITVRVFALRLNNLDNRKDYENNYLILVFKSIYSFIGGLQFEGLDDIKFNCMAWYNNCLLPLYYILPSIIGLMTIAKLSQSLVYEYYCKIKWRFKTFFTGWNSSQEVYVFTSLTDDTVQLARSTFKKNTNAKIIFYGNHIPRFDNHNLLCRKIKSYGWYYFTNLDGKSKFKDSKSLEDSNRRFKSSILHRLHLMNKNYAKLCIISMHLNSDLKPNDELNLDISYKEFQTYIDGFLKKCLGKKTFKNRTLCLFLYYAKLFLESKKSNEDLNLNLIRLYKKLIDDNSKNEHIDQFMKDESRYFKKLYSFDSNVDKVTLKKVIDVIEDEFKVKSEKIIKKLRKRFENIKPKGLFKSLELYTLVGKEINYQAYQQTIDDFKKQVMMYLGVSSENTKKEREKIYWPPEFYVLNEASLVADDLVESINKCNSLCHCDDNKKEISRGIVVGFGEIGQNTVHNLYTQYNLESKNVVFDVYDSKVNANGSGYSYWNCEETFSDYKINHPYFRFVFDESPDLEARKTDYNNNSEQALLDDLLTLRLSSINSLYTILDANSGLDANSKTKFERHPDIIVLTTGSDEQNIKYANFLINDIESEFNDREQNKEIIKQIIAVNIREDINNNLLNLHNFDYITNNVYKWKNNEVFVIIFGNTDEIYSCMLLDHEDEKTYNYGYNLIYDNINGTDYSLYISYLPYYADNYFSKDDSIALEVGKGAYQKIVSKLSDLSNNNPEITESERDRRNKLWKENAIFDCLSNKSARLFLQNFKSIYNDEEYLKENIIREHNRWCRFYMSYGWRYRANRSKPNKKHDCLIDIKWVPEKKRFLDIINVAWSAVDLDKVTKNFKNSHREPKIKEKKNESTKNSNN